MIHEGSFANALLETFSLPISVCIEPNPIAEMLLTQGEQAVLAQLTSPVRR